MIYFPRYFCEEGVGAVGGRLTGTGRLPPKLFRQPGCFEGLRFRIKSSYVGDHAVAEPVAPDEDSLDADAAAPPARSMACDDEHPVGAELADLPDVEMSVSVEGPKPLAKPLADRLAPMKRAAADSLRNPKDDIVGVGPHRSLKIAFVDGCVLILDDLDILLRHGQKYLEEPAPRES